MNEVFQLSLSMTQYRAGKDAVAISFIALISIIM